MRASVVAAVAGFAITLGAGSAFGSNLTIHRTRNAGMVKPVGSAATRQSSASPRLAQSAALGGDTSPFGGTPPLLYGGGPVMHAVTTHVIAWAPSGYVFPAPYVSGYEQYLSDLRHDLGLSTNITSVLAQYSDAGGSAMTSLTNDAPISDADPYPASGCFVSGASVCLTESQVVAEVAHEITSSGLSADVNESYILLLPPGVDSCVDGSGAQCEAEFFCGYHTAFEIGGGNYTSFTLVPYPESVYSNSGGTDCTDGQGPSGVPADVMALDGIGAHELMESATDPLPGEGYVDSTNFEVADECTGFYTPMSTATGGGSYNQLVNGNQYLIQDMWSNQAAACVQGQASTATAPITAPTTVATGLTATLSAALAHDGTGASSYSWSYQDPAGATHLGFASGPSAQLTLSSTGHYTVWVNVTDTAGGTITGVASIAAVPAPTPLFTWSPAQPRAAAAVSFTSGALAGDGYITGYQWNFGDGGTSTDGAPAHVYAAPGNYNVTLTVTQTDGLTASVQHSITVAAQAPNSAWLSKELAAGGKHLSIASVIRRNGTTVVVNGATESGRIRITWYATVKHHRIVVARGSASVTSGVAAHVVIRLTGAGRALLRRSRSVRITVSAVYTDGGPSVTATRTVTLKR